jgi:hypothetical protein
MPTTTAAKHPSKHLGGKASAGNVNDLSGKASAGKRDLGGKASAGNPSAAKHPPETPWRQSIRRKRPSLWLQQPQARRTKVRRDMKPK